MTSAAASRHGRSTALPPARPAAAPNGPVTVGSLLRREGRAAHSQDRPVVPRARDLADDGRGSAHRAAVTAGAFLAVTAVLGTNVLGGAALGPTTEVDDGAASGPDRPVVPAPPSPLSLAATAAPLGHALAVLRAAGSPVLAVMDDTTAGRAPTSGAGIVAQALGGVPFAAPASGTPGADVSASATEHATDDDRAATHDPDSGSRGRHRSTTTTHRSSRSDGGSDRGTPALHLPPVLVDPGLVDPGLVDPGLGPTPPTLGGTAAGGPSGTGGTTSPTAGGTGGAVGPSGPAAPLATGGSGADDAPTRRDPAQPTVDGPTPSTTDAASAGAADSNAVRDTADGSDTAASSDDGTRSSSTDAAKTDGAKTDAATTDAAKTDAATTDDAKASAAADSDTSHQASVAAST